MASRIDAPEPASASVGRERRTWRAMWRRCTIVSDGGYRNYGGRGIRVCKEWESFDVFFRDMGPRPPGHSLDRKDNDGDYTPDNCRWATNTQQQRNRRNTRRVTVNGETLSAAEAAERAGLSPFTYRWRLRCGATPEEAAAPPSQDRKPKEILIGGRAFSVRRFGRILGANDSSIRKFLRLGWDPGADVRVLLILAAYGEILNEHAV